MKTVETVEILDFEVTHNLLLHVKTRPISSDLPPHYTSFQNSEVQGVGVLIGGWQ